MSKLNKKNLSTIVFMIVFAVVIVYLYYYMTTHKDPSKETADGVLTEYQQLINVDLEQNYPATPKEVVKLFGRTIKYLYDEPKEEEIKPLALKLRELYDVEFLLNNPVDGYLEELNSELASWKKNGRRITNYRVANDDGDQDSEIDGVRYTIKYISYTIKEKGKFTETWKVLLKQDEDKKWKILGWGFVPSDEQVEK